MSHRPAIPGVLVTYRCPRRAYGRMGRAARVTGRTVTAQRHNHVHVVRVGILFQGLCYRIVAVAHSKGEIQMNDTITTTTDTITTTNISVGA